jgi:hypothetical protein
MKKETISSLNLLLKPEYINKWISYRGDERTINVICYMANLKLITLDLVRERMKVNPHNAKLFLEQG